jgi:hypothetical protein
MQYAVLLTKQKHMVKPCTSIAAVDKTKAHGKVMYLNQLFKVPLKAKIVQILFSQIHKNYAEYTFQTFTVDGIAIAYQIESLA